MAPVNRAMRAIAAVPVQVVAVTTAVVAVVITTAAAAAVAAAHRISVEYKMEIRFPVLEQEMDML
jgi:hypothetical protein